ncbi:MAG: HAMP domain-containing histidine kinase [Clostridiales bacterium]|nr:HAMP domain-containing histidine kinase [Clostridiales bacterium]
MTELDENKEAQTDPAPPSLGEKSRAVVRALGEDRHEAVFDTLNEIKSENKGKKKRKRTAGEIALLVVKIIFFPITLIVMAFKRISSRFKIGITAKTTLVFAVIFGVMLVTFAAFILASVANIINSGEELTGAFMSQLVITSVVLLLSFIAFGSALGGLASQYMMSPVRKMNGRIKEISDENMSARLDPVDSQDELKELTERINHMLDTIQEAFERQENFVSDASHELKTPLAVITGYADLLRRWGKDDPKVLNEAVEAISRESQNMKRIVEQLLWLAKLGDFSLNNTQFNLYETVSDIVDGYRTVNIKHKISLTGDMSVTLNADKNLMTEAIRTLVDNAIKYTPADGGEINIAITKEDNVVELSIADNGIGISDDDIEHIFERFYRCDKVRGRESGSSGLGLTICKSIVDMMNGKISVVSKLGEGSTFTIKLYQ